MGNRQSEKSVYTRNMGDKLQKEVDTAKDEETLLLIKWNAETGDFVVIFSGQPIHLDDLAVVLHSSYEELQKCASNSGWLNTSKDSIEQDKIGDDEDDEIESDDKPDWLKLN